MDNETIHLLVTIVAAAGAVSAAISRVCHRRQVAYRIGAWTIIIVSGAVMFSYVIGKSGAWAWPVKDGVPMALVTAVCLHIVGWCLVEKGNHK